MKRGTSPASPFLSMGALPLSELLASSPVRAIGCLTGPARSSHAGRLSRPASWFRLTGESPVRVGNGAPGSRPPFVAERWRAEREEPPPAAVWRFRAPAAYGRDRCEYPGAVRRVRRGRRQPAARRGGRSLRHGDRCRRGPGRPGTGPGPRRPSLGSRPADSGPSGPPRSPGAPGRRTPGMLPPVPQGCLRRKQVRLCGCRRALAVTPRGPVFRRTRSARPASRGSVPALSGTDADQAR
jgi:hypothetical protein